MELAKGGIKEQLGERDFLHSRKAVELSDQLPPPERYLIQASHDQILRNYPKAIEAYENLAKAAPDNADVLFELAGLYKKSGAYDKAREEYTRVSRSIRSALTLYSR